MNRMVLVMMAITVLIGCNNDDDGGGSVAPPRDRDEVQVENDAALVEYLETHFYNYEDFQNPPVGFDYKIEFDTIAAANSDKRPLIQDVETKQFTLADVEYNLYVLKVREGEGLQATYTDSVFVNYKGQLLDGERFDSSASPIWFNLAGNLGSGGFSGPIFGFANGIDSFRGATSIALANDGTLEYSNDFGVGAVFLPSGLGYFSATQSRIPAYSNLIFTFRVYDTVPGTDNDGDGVPNIKEDLDSNGTPQDDDTDSDGLPDFLDADDDNDGIPTRDEIEIDADGNVTYPDTDGDGTPDYLDAATE